MMLQKGKRLATEKSRSELFGNPSVYERVPAFAVNQQQEGDVNGRNPRRAAWG
jgi:hypothetical protein